MDALTNRADGFEALFCREYRGIVHTVTLILGDEGLAREVSQEAFARALARWSRLRAYDRPDAWVRLVAVRLAVRARDRRTREAAPPVDVGHPPHDPVPALDLSRALLTLPRSLRAVIVLHYLHDLPVDEVAKHMGCRPSTARAHLHRARERLGTVLREEEPDGVH